MPRVATTTTTIAKAYASAPLCEALDTAPPVPRPRASSFGFGEGVCTCARCMRKAGPIREDVEERIVQISYVLADVTNETPSPEDVVKEHHRTSAENFMAAVEEGNCAKLKRLFGLLEYDDMKEEIATELIISASQLGHADIIKFLADMGADIEENDLRRGGRALMHAANNGHTAAVKTLIDAGADVEARDANGYTALMVSIFSDRSSAAEALLTAGAEVDAVDDKGRTALCHAALYGSTDCIYLLANAGANVFHADREGATPLELAEDSVRTSAVEALKKLQMKVKMQERRRNRQKANCNGQLDEQERANAARLADVNMAHLLMEIELEEAQKKAKAAKKKKGKGKPHAAADSHSEASNDTHHDSNGRHHGHGDEPVASQAAVRRAHKHSAGHANGLHSDQSRQPNGWPAPAPGSTSGSSKPGAAAGGAPGGAAGAGARHWLDELLLAKAGQPGCGNGTAEAVPRGVPSPSSPSTTAAPSPGAPLAPDTPCTAADGAAAAGCSEEQGASSVEGGSVDVDALRRSWDALLEEAAKCMDPARQPAMLEQVEAMMARCVAAGVSVKYGRKIQQRLAAVGPARAALTAALAARPMTSGPLDEALRACRGCRSLLDTEWVAGAEATLDALKAAEEQQRWDALAMALKWDHKPFMPPQQLQPQHQAQQHQHQHQQRGGYPQNAATPFPVHHPQEPHNRDVLANGGGFTTAAQSAGGYSQPPRRHSVLAAHPALQMAADILGEDELDAEAECVVCLSAAKNQACIPCGHICMCQECARDVQGQSNLCPVCRCEIETMIEVLG